MITEHRLPGRRLLLAGLALSAALAVSGGFAIGAVSASAQTVSAQPQMSANWAGYVARSSSGQNFSSVSGSWTQPAVTSGSSTGSAYSAFWVGLGGASQQSQSLEQVGTSSDWAGGQATYYAWYELVPSTQVKLNLAIHPGDHMYGRVTVNGTEVTVSLSDQTAGQSVTKTLQMSNPDTSSAEWIAEAPSAQTPAGGLQQLALANFGTVTFTNAYATAGGHTGSISDPNWSLQQVQLSPSASTEYLGGGSGFTPAGLGTTGQQAGSGATPSNVSSGGSSFSVSYTSSSGAAQSSTGGSGGYVYVYPGGSYGDGYPGGGYAYGYPGGGYGYPGYGYGYYGSSGYAY